MDNPLAAYPNRDWERIYRDIYRTDTRFTFLCCPNDTHNCLLNAHVKNNVVVRIEPTYGYSKAQDLYGNKASARWDPRCCQKGLVLARRFYGDRRVNGAFLRKGFKDWVDKGFPRDPVTAAAPKELMRRGWDSWVKVSHEEAFAYHAKTLMNIAQTYSGEDGTKRLLAQGYDPDMAAAAGGAGTRVMKFRGGMAKQVRHPNLRELPHGQLHGAEYCDIVYGVNSWMEFKHPDMTASNTNPFVQIYPRTPAKRAFSTISDNETYLGVARELTKLTGDKRFEDMWRFIAEKRADVYLQRIIDGSTLFTRISDWRSRGVGETRRPGAYEHALLSAHQLLRASQREQALVHQDRAA